MARGISVITATAMPAITSNLVKMGPVVVGVARDAVVRLGSLWGAETVRLKSAMALFLIKAAPKTNLASKVFVPRRSRAARHCRGLVSQWFT
jgi:hypothetical protein